MTSAAPDWVRAPELAGFGHVRAADEGDAVAGVAARIVIEPTTPEQVAGALAWASREGLATVIRGRGTKITWGRVAPRIDVILAMSRLTSLVAHRHGDLTATVQAGLTLSDLNRQLARQGQWLPVDTAFDHATVGGLVATNDAGPLRHRYGTPRDLLIGITLALTDGRLVKSGGHVVKNVAGYDLGKLVSGSFGGLAAIVDATFKLLPIPQTTQTVVARYDDGETLARDAGALTASQLDPVAFDLQVQLGENANSGRVLALMVRFATSPEATAAQALAASSLLTGSIETLSGAREAALWAEQVRRPWTLEGVVVKLSWLPADLSRVLATLDGVHRSAAGPVELVARASVGAGFLRLNASAEAVAIAVERLRAERVVSNVVVLRQPGALRRRIDPWGQPGSPVAVLRSLKETFDPAGILNAGRGPV